MPETPPAPDKPDSEAPTDPPLSEVVLNAMLLNTAEFLEARRKTSIKEVEIKPPEEPPELIG